MPATAETWVPATQDALEAFQKRVIGHILRERPNYPLRPLKEEIVPNAFADAYAFYLEQEADESIVISDAEGYLLAVCVNKALNEMRGTARRDARIEVRPASAPDSDEANTRPDVSIEDAASKDASLIEKYSPVSQAIRNDQKNVLLSTLASLPEGQREAFRRCILQKQPQTEAAKEIGIGIRPLEKRLLKAVSQVAWHITQTSRESMCDEYTTMTVAMSDPENPNRAEQAQIFKHVQSCSACKYAVYDSPFAFDMGALLATGGLTSHWSPSIGERIGSFPIVEVPTEMVRSVWEKVWPGSHGAEAAVGGGTAAGGAGAGGTVLAVGGGKAILTLCAGVATTACVAGVATGVIPVTKSAADKDADANVATERTAAANAPSFVDTRANYETHRAEIEQTIDRRAGRRAAKRQARIEARKAAAAAASGESTPTSSDTSTGSSSESSQASYSSPVTTTPTTQTETNESSASSSMGISTSSAPATSSSSSSSSAQAQTNQSSANDSFGIGQ